MSSYSRQQLEKFLKEVNITGRVIDIGGSQKPIERSRVKSWNATSYKILDLETPHNTEIEPDLVFNIEDGNTYDIAEFEKYFDMAFCLEVSEYWYNPLKALQNINYLLKSGGRLFISFHFLYPQHNPIKEDCLRYTKAGVEKLLNKSGFKVKKIKIREFKEATFYRMLIANEGMRSAGDINEQGYFIEAIKK